MYNNEEYLRDKLISQQVPIKELANSLGVPRSRICYLVQKYKLSKDIREARLNQIIGSKFGRMTILSYHSTKSGHAVYNCQCDCGNIISCALFSVKNGHSHTCGCKTKNRLSNQEWEGYGEISKSLFSSIKNGAIKRKFEFTITIEYIWDLYLKQDRKCALTGQDIIFVRNSKSKYNSKGTASLDRIDSSKGYIEGNVQWLHKWINIMKLDHSQEEFIELCNKVTSYSLKKIKT